MKLTSTFIKAAAAVFAILMILTATFAPILANDYSTEETTEESSGTRVLCTTETFELAGAHDEDGKPCAIEDHPAFAQRKEEAVSIVEEKENTEAKVSHEAVELSCRLLHSLF